MRHAVRMENSLKFRTSRSFVLLAVAGVWLLCGIAARWLAPTWAHGVWLVGLVATSAPMLFSAVQSLARGNVNVDLIA